jgi:hypothetical protein
MLPDFLGLQGFQKIKLKSLPRSRSTISIPGQKHSTVVVRNFLAFLAKNNFLTIRVKKVCIKGFSFFSFSEKAIAVLWV